jgi:cytochrome c oxidase accessory protein FixG
MEDYNPESFRDSISTVDKEGKRVWVYPKKPNGRYYNFRKWLSYGLLAFLFSAPFVHINGNPIMLLNIFERKFVIMGIPFLPQDFHLFVLAMIAFIVFIILFTVVYGRLFCGYICPQTIFMEMVFRRIEYWIEGDATQQRKLDKQPWNKEKIIKKTGKQILFFSIAFLIANTFMAYLVGREQWFEIVTQPPSEHLIGFIGLVFFSFAFYGVFSVVREQVCTTICPYGRLQGVLLDKDSMVIAYDHVRGEPRGKLEKDVPEELRKHGDCIDCNLCVQVCPTAIDIRNGTQLECVNCTACIDACDEVMDKIDKPRGLIRYASFNNIENKTSFTFTNRIIAYSVVLVFLIGVFTFALLGRSEIETTILRTPGTLFQETQEGNIVNIYNIQLANKTTNELTFELRLEEGAQGKLKLIKNERVIAKQSVFDSAILIEIPKTELKERKTDIKIGVYSDGKKIDDVKTHFIGPMK